MTIEDFTIYTEVDPNNRITVTSTRSSWAALTEQEDAYVYKYKGVAWFNGNYEHLLTVYWSAASGTYVAVNCWGLANLVDDWTGIQTAAGDEHNIRFQKAVASLLLILEELFAGASYQNQYTCSLNTPYYLKIKRNEAIGTYGTLYCYIYSDAARTNLLATLSLALHEKEDFRYIYVTQSFNSGVAGRSHTGYSENLNLQEAKVGSALLPVLESILL